MEKEMIKLDELIKQEIKNNFTNNLMETLNSAFIFKYVQTLEEQNKKQKEIIDKAIEGLKQGITFCENDSQGIHNKCNIAINREKKILEILEENAKVSKLWADSREELRELKKIEKEHQKINGNLRKEIKDMKEDINFCLKSIKQEMKLSKDSRTRSEMKDCYEILKRWKNE